MEDMSDEERAEQMARGKRAMDCLVGFAPEIALAILWPKLSAESRAEVMSEMRKGMN